MQIECTLRQISAPYKLACIRSVTYLIIATFTKHSSAIITKNAGISGQIEVIIRIHYHVL